MEKYRTDLRAKRGIGEILKIPRACDLRIEPYINRIAVSRQTVDGGGGSGSRNSREVADIGGTRPGSADVQLVSCRTRVSPSEGLTGAG